MASGPFHPAVYPQEKRYDVFICFRGEDTRSPFASYLYAALYDKKILAFMDHKLERGSEISPTLRKAIDESTIAVVILSENFANSTWCLDELVQIVEGKKRNGRIVMPIFYGIDPYAVRKQEGIYKVAFAALEERFKDRMEKVEQWRAALTEVANLSGLDSKEFRSENQLIQKIVDDVLLELPKYSTWNIDCYDGRLFAIQKHLEEIDNLLVIGSKDVLIVGIWGMPGIGKTTLASLVFQRFLIYHFEGRSYLWNVRKEYESSGPNSLRKKLLDDLLTDEAVVVRTDTPFVASPFIQDRLRRKKVLIVLDDVDSQIQLDTLIGGYHQLGPGSRIIVTSRNRRVLVNVANGIYKVEGLNYIESLKLFHLHAFGKNSMAIDYESLSESVANYANGNPLALKVLGSFLHSRSKEEWESALEKLKKDSNEDILPVFRISYEGLKDRRYQNIFLDIACFLDRPFTVEYAESILDDGGSSAKIGISVLIDKTLIENCHQDESKFQMHDLIRQMGRSIVSDEHQEPGNRSRLCNADDVCHVLEKNTGTTAIEGIVFDMSKIKRDVKISPVAFSKMCKLRFLKIYCDDIDNNKCKLCLPRSFEPFASNELRYFRWDLYPFKYLPSDFAQENLVELILRHSHLKQLGNHVVKSFPKLQNLDLSNSKLLTRLPDLSPAPNLKSINLEGCTRLFKILSSIQNLDKLKELNLNYCTNLGDLEEMAGRTENSGLVKHRHVRNLVNNIFPLNFTFVMGSIINFVTKFPLYSSSPFCTPRFPINLTSLSLGGTSMEALPSSVCCVSGLVHLDLRGCKRLKWLPTSICKLKSLASMRLKECSNLEEFPEILEPMGKLSWLDLDEAAIEKLPESIENLVGLRHLSLRTCKKLQFLPNNLSKLSGLDFLYLNNCSRLETLPSCPLGLKELSVSNCWSLKLILNLPSCFNFSLDASNCTSMEDIRGWTSSLSGKVTNKLSPGTGMLLTNCLRLNQNTWNNFIDASIVSSMTSCAMFFDDLGDNLGFFHCGYTGDEIPNYFGYQCLGNSLTNINLPPHWNSDDLLGVVFCIVLDLTNIVDHRYAYAIHYQIHDEHEHKYDYYVGIGELEIKPDLVLMWCKTKNFKGRSWFNTCSNITKVSFYVKTSLDNRHVDVGSENLIKKCGIRLIYKKDPAQFVNSDINEFVVATGNRVVGSRGGDHDDEEKHRADESPSTSKLKSNPSTKRNFDGGEQDDDGDDESQPLINSKKIKLVQK